MKKALVWVGEVEAGRRFRQQVEWGDMFTALGYEVDVLEPNRAELLAALPNYDVMAFRAHADADRIWVKMGEVIYPHQVEDLWHGKFVHMYGCDGMQPKMGNTWSQAFIKNGGVVVGYDDKTSEREKDDPYPAIGLWQREFRYNLKGGLSVRTSFVTANNCRPDVVKWFTPIMAGDGLIILEREVKEMADKIHVSRTTGVSEFDTAEEAEDDIQINPSYLAIFMGRRLGTMHVSSVDIGYTDESGDWVSV